jgi:hypothetical protein
MAHNLFFTSVDSLPRRLQFNLDLPSDWLIIDHQQRPTCDLYSHAHR